MIAIAGGKGGCGKTTATLGVARALARAGCDPLVVDADTDLPDLHLVADVEREPTATAVARGRPPTTVCHRSAAAAGIAVLPAGSPESTPAALSRLQDWHGPVLVDCPAGAGRDATVPMRYSDGTVVVRARIRKRWGTRPRRRAWLGGSTVRSSRRFSEGPRVGQSYPFAVAASSAFLASRAATEDRPPNRFSHTRRSALPVRQYLK